MQNLINNILREYFNKFYIIYLDNILIFSNNIEKYVEYITAVLKVLEKVGFWIKPKKCAFYINKVKYLKFIIINWGLRINSAKI